MLQLIAIDAVVNFAYALQPEPLERFLYSTGVLLLPFCLLAAYLVVRRFSSGSRTAVLRRLEPAIYGLSVAVTFGLFVSAGLAEQSAQVKSFIPGGWRSFAAALALSLAASTAGLRRLAERFRHVPPILAALAVGTLLLGTLAISVFREEHIRNIPIYWASFNAIFYSVVQVFLGRELTVDFINMYGLHPHLLEPLFSVVGLSVFSFTLLMGLLNGLAFGCLHLFLVRETRSHLIGTLGTTSVFFFTYAFARAVPQPDHYFQYHPLRIVFPSLLILLAQAFAHRPRSWTPAVLGATGAAAFLWTTDVGIVTLVSILLFVGYDAVSRESAREVALRLLQAIAAAGGVLLLFSLWLWFRHGAFPSYLRLLLYPKAFYLHGYGMMPMPRFGLWVPVLAIYAFGLLRSLVSVVEKEVRPRDKIRFLLAVLGLGLFSYYQGRSVLGNLAAASYPAILLLCLFADDLRRSAAGRALPQRALLFMILTFLSFSVPALAAIAPTWVRGIAEKMEVSRRGGSTDVLRDVQFLQGLLRPGEEVVIMSYQSGLLHLATRTTNPLDIPGDSELVYRRDFDKQSDYVLQRRGKAVVDKTTMSPQFIALIRSRFRDRIENPAGNLIFLPHR